MMWSSTPRACSTLSVDTFGLPPRLPYGLLMRDYVYPPVIVTAKAWFKALGLRFQLIGTEHVPRTGGAVLAYNHISYVDFILGGYAALPNKRLVRFMANESQFRHRISGPLMRGMRHIAVDRRAGAASYTDAVRYLRAGELVGVFPEATISRSSELKEFKTGAVRMATEADVPIVPVVLWGTQRLLTKDHPRDFSRGKTIAITVGPPITPGTDEDPYDATQRLRSTMADLLKQTVDAYPAAEQPPGSWWLPASYGGSAPTPERAEQLDAEEKARRA
jgi:1-acyl-sn-glycerol-3-phosphate acyltransferase